MALDQAHEQNNGAVKSDGGAVGLTQNPQALRRWMVAGPEVVRMTAECKKAALKCTALCQPCGGQNCDV